MINKKIVGYTTGAFDLFHIGHLQILQKSKAMCDKLIVGVSTDELVIKAKSKKPTIPFLDRMEIVKSIKYVDVVVPQEDRDKIKAWKKLKFDILFVGDDWFGDKTWETYEKELNKQKVKIIYFPYTKGISSTLLQKKIKNDQFPKSI